MFPLDVAAAQSGRQPFIETFRHIDREHWYLSDGWSNGDWTANDWRARQVRANRRGLFITLDRVRGQQKPFSSGEIQSRRRFQYGYFEVRMRAPRASGTITGFFTFVRDGGAESWDEIDIEILGRDTRSIQFTSFTNGQSSAHVARLPFDAADAMHSYAFDWQPERISWYVDGVLFHQTEEGAPIPQRPQLLITNLWNTETLTRWAGPLLPWHQRSVLHVECIAYSPAHPGPNTTLCDSARQ